MSRGLRVITSGNAARSSVPRLGGPRTAQGRSPAGPSHKNNLLNRIAKITLASHNQITENQLLKEKLEDLAHE